MDEAERKNAAALMRVNHSGEICAQALYQGQALTARDPVVQQKLQQAAQEETEHLAWTARRVHELGGHLSLLNPFWYTGSLAIGAVAGLLGDKWNLGFLAETERQVGHHLQSHLDRLPQQDEKSRAIVAQMHADEVGHADMASSLGGAELPQPVQLAMKLNGKVMTGASYWV
jgi:ubiquinone biosynthesis monooxygenase Coq7